MQKEDIKMWDWERIAFGDNPGLFMLEVFLRTIIIYLLLLIVMRILGKKMGATNSILEMTVIISLGAIVSVPMQVSDRGVLPGIIILICAMLFYLILSRINVKSNKAEEIAVGEVSMIVKDGVIDIPALKSAGISHEQLFTQLREREIKHLGEVKRVYLEGCGLFSVYKEEKVRPGFVILPGEDQGIFKNIIRSNGIFSCKKCGNSLKVQNPDGFKCNNCGAKIWDKAIMN